MRKTIMKSTLAVALVAAAAFGGAKTYGAYAPVSQSDLLLSENVEAQAGFDPIEWLVEKLEKLLEKHYDESRPKCEVEVEEIYGDYPDLYIEKFTIPGHETKCAVTDDENKPTSCRETSCLADHS